MPHASLSRPSVRLFNGVRLGLVGAGLAVAVSAGFGGSATDFPTAAATVALAVVVLLALTYRHDRLTAGFRAREARFRDFTEAAADWHWELDADLRFTDISDGFEAAAGKPPVDVIGKRHDELVDGANPPPRWQQHLENLEKRRPFRNFVVRIANGTQAPRYWRISGKPVFDPSGTFLGYRGTGDDITKQVLTEQAAGRTQRLLTEALEEIGEGFALYDSEDRLVMWNTRYAQLYRDTGDLIVAGARFEDIIRTAASRGTIREALDETEAWIGKRLALHRAPRSTHERRFVDGRWIRVNECRLSDGSYVGIHADITDAKYREAELAEFARKNALLAAAVSTTTSGVVIADARRPDQPVIYVNPAFTAVTGYAPAESLGRSAKDLLCGDTGTADSPMHEVLRTGKSVTTRALHKHKDGTPIHFDLNLSPVRDQEDRITHIVGVQHDVTAQVLWEERLRESEEGNRRQAALLQDAIEALADGFVLYDAEDRFALCNSKFRELRASNPLSYQPGARFEDILRSAIARGELEIPAGFSADGWVRHRLEMRRAPSGARVTKSGDRWIRVSERRTRDGGMVAIHSDITELKNAQAEVEAARARMTDWAEASNDWFWETDREYRLRFMSDRNKPGRSPMEKVLGQRAIDTATDVDSEPEKWRDHMAALDRHEPFRNFVFRTKGKAGGECFLSSSGKPVFDPSGRFLGYRGTARDVTTEVQAEKSAARSRKLLEEALEATEEGFAIWDADDRLVLCNGNFRRLHDKIADLYVPGAVFENVVRAAVARGAVPNAIGREDALIAERLAAHRAGKGAFESRLASGRWKRVKEYRMADGGIVGVHIDITEQKLREIELGELARRNALFFAAVSRATSGMAIADAKMDGKPVIYVNPAFTSLCGYRDDDVIGQDSDFLYTSELAPETAAAIHAAIAACRPIETRLPTRHRAGHRIWLDLRVSPVEDRDGNVSHFVFVSNDVTAQVLAEDALRENEERLRGLANNLPGVLFQKVMKTDGTIRHTYYSDRIADFTGREAASFLADETLFDTIVAPEHRAAYQTAIAESAKAMEPREISFEYMNPLEERRWARSVFRPRALPNGDILWDGAIFDITDQMHSEAQRVDLENQLRHSQKIEALGTLAGGIAHDINNTLVPIVALSKIALKGLPAGSPLSTSMQTILDASHRARDLVAQILAFSRKEMPKTSTLLLQDVVSKTLRLLAATLPPNISLVPSLNADVPPVAADENQVVQVLMNLCTNAAHAIGHEGGTIKIGLEAITIADKAGAHPSGLPHGGYARLTIADSGCGMDSRTLQRIFEPFFTTKGVGEGTGLGLSVVHGIIAGHRGRITVESEVGRGTTFTILLPLAGDNASETSAPASPAQQPAYT